MSIDFSKAPEGATHYMRTTAVEGVTWHRVHAGVVDIWYKSRWVVSAVNCDSPLLKLIPFVGVEDAMVDAMADAMADAGVLDRSQATMLKTHQQIKRLEQATTGNTHDPVNNPSHYASGGVECIEAIKASMSHESFLGYLKGNVQKYLWRYEKKANPVEDLKKAQWYLARLTKEQEGE